MAQKPISEALLQLRRQNALALFARWRLQEIAQGRSASDSAFAAVLGIANAQWSRIKSGTPVGAKLARQIEAACGMEHGWLDEPAHSDSSLELLSGEQGQAAVLKVFGPGAALSMPRAEHSTPAGFPSPAADFEVNTVNLVDQMGLNEPSTFIARVRGLSMIGKGIDDGDLLVINKALTPAHGQTVVAVIDNELTCKTLYRREGLVKLQAANPDFPDIVPKEGQTMTIWGVVTAVIKKMVV